MTVLVLFYNVQGDRFIPNRSSMDFDLARYLLLDARKQKENLEVVSPSREAYRKHLAEAAMMNRTRILNFTNQPPTSVNRNCKEVFSESISNYQVKSMKQRRYISKVGSLIIS